MNESKYYVYLLVMTYLLIFSVEIIAQYAYPLNSVNTDDFTSAYGPRNLSTSEYPNSNYDYDFHAGIDIRAAEGTSVYSQAFGRKIASGNTWLVMEYDITIEGQVFYEAVKYTHVKNIISNTDNVMAGAEICQIGYWAAGTHLDIRYYWDGYTDDGYIDYYTYNPGPILGNLSNYSNSPIILDKDGTAMDDTHSYIFIADSDNSTNSNNAGKIGKKYFEFKVRVNDEELDLNNIVVSLENNDPAPFPYYSTSQLLIDDSELEDENIIDYDSRTNCGDINAVNDDFGNINDAIFIIPTDFTDTATPETYHEVRYRFYLNEDNFNSCSKINLVIYVEDWGGNSTVLSDIYFFPNENACTPPFWIRKNIQPKIVTQATNKGGK